MRVYATVDETWPTVEPPANADSLLLLASALVEDATKTAVYPTDAEGYPSNTGTAQVFADATKAQALFWQEQGLDPAAGAAKVASASSPTSKTIGSASLNYSVSLIEAGTQAQITALFELCTLAYWHLKPFLDGQAVRL
jgi:hypothetical protein